MADKITQPKDGTLTVDGCVAKLKWSPTFASKRNKEFEQAQRFIDSEVLRYDDPMVPMDTGTLKNSGTRYTVLGSGEVRYVTPYAAYQYYSTSETRSYDHNRGGMWFERMKRAYGETIRKGAAKYLS